MADIQTLHAGFAAKIDAVLNALEMEGHLPPETNRSGVTVEPPRDPSHGDLATNAAMVLAKQARTNPRALAELIVEHLEREPDITEASIAGPGFINLRLSEQAWLRELEAIAALSEDYGRSQLGGGQRVNVEYVSANPTGPMHMGHCRGAVVGDALAGLLEFSGHKVIREYYVNDAGGQVDVLARSAHLRYREALGEEIEIPEGLYPGDYLKPVGERLAQEFGPAYKDAPESEWLELFRERAVDAMMDMIREDLSLLGIHHDLFSSEAKLQAAKKPEGAEAWLREHGFVYDGVLEAPKGKAPPEDWEPVELPLFRSTEFGDDQDRPIKKFNGAWTYFGADLAYHFQKAENADALIDIWGADHAGTVKRIKAAVAALTKGAGRDVPFDVKLVQMVNLMRDGEPVKMSKRSGTFVTLADVVKEVGKDVVRFTMLTRKPEAQMEFDFAKVVEASKDNPVFYLQYAHARICSTLRKAGVEPSAENLDRLGADELALVREAAQFPRVVEAAAKAREPHRIAFFLGDLAAAFHSFWNAGNDDPAKRIIQEDDAELTAARLFVAAQVGQVIRNGLGILGVEAVEEM